MTEFTALPTDGVRALQNGQPDVYGNIPELAISDGDGKPCRHCLSQIAKGAQMLILAYRPFVGLHPYAETGPIFLCADECARGGGHELPEVLSTSPDYLIKGYSDDDRIIKMFTALTRVAQDQQIIVFSCRQLAFQDLGGARPKVEVIDV